MFPPFPPPGACSRFWPVLFPAAGFCSMEHAALQSLAKPARAAARNCRQKKGACRLSRPHALLVRFLPLPALAADRRAGRAAGGGA